MANSVLYSNCNLIDGKTDNPRNGMDIFVVDGIIMEIGNGIHIPVKTEKVDLTGMTVLPGLIDVHVHMAFDCSKDPVSNLSNDSDYFTLIKMVNNSHRQLKQGITTVRDMGGPRELIITLRDATQQGLLIGPRLVISGEVITSPGGHGHFMGHEVQGSQNLQKAALEELGYGVDVLKIMPTGGSLTPGPSVFITQFSQDEIQAVVKEAHQRGIKVAAHANATDGIRNAIEAGVDSIEHGSFADRDSLIRMTQKGTWLVPTMAPAEILLASPLITEERRKDVQRNWDSRREVVKKVIDLGVRLASGTDAGVTYVQHGQVAMEIELFHKLGLGPMQAIWTATSGAAELLGVDDETGCLIEGKKADMIVVDGDPLRDLQLLQQPKMVISGDCII